MYILLTILLIICAANVALTIRLTKLIQGIQQPVIPEAKPEKTKERTILDDKATVAEQRYIDGIQSVLSYDVNIAKEFLRGAEKD